MWSNNGQTLPTGSTTPRNDSPKRCTRSQEHRLHVQAMCKDVERNVTRRLLSLSAGRPDRSRRERECLLCQAARSRSSVSDTRESVHWRVWDLENYSLHSPSWVECLGTLPTHLYDVPFKDHESCHRLCIIRESFLTSTHNYNVRGIWMGEETGFKREGIWRHNETVKIIRRTERLINTKKGGVRVLRQRPKRIIKIK